MKMDQKQNQVKGLIEELGLGNLPEDKKNDMIVKLAESFQNKLTVRLMESMSDSEKQKLDDLVGQGKDDEVVKYLSQIVPNIDTVAREEFEKFRAEVLSENARIKKMITEEMSQGSPDTT